MDLKSESDPNPHSVRKNPCLNSAMNKLYTDRSKTGDIKFAIDGKVIRAHRCVLAALSPKYEAQFYGALAEKDTINVKGVSPGAFAEFLQFFYKDQVALTLENIEDVLNLAKQSLVDELVTECINYLIDTAATASMEKMHWYYRLALSYDSKPLERFCIGRIPADIKAAFQTTDLLYCERDLLCRILDQEELYGNEVHIFDACISWAQAKCEQNGIDAANTTNLRMALGEAIFKIRFCSMKVEEFATANRKYSGILSAEESIDIFNAIILKAKSSTFGQSNSKPRGCTVVEEIKSSLECSFNRGPRLEVNPPIEDDFILLVCNSKIKINGFIISSRVDDEIEVEVEMTNETILPAHSALISKNETKIIFDNPIEMAKHSRATIRFTPKTVQQFGTRLYGYKLLEKVEQNGILFKIRHHGVESPNLFKTLLFDI